MTDDIANRLQRVREIYCLSQRELAKRAGVTNSSVSMIEQGRVSPSIGSLTKLLGGIPMTLNDFFTVDFTNELHSFFKINAKDNLEPPISENMGYLLSEDDRSELYYEIFPAGTDTGEGFCVNAKRVSGFVVQGSLNITISGETDILHSGDGFIVEAKHPYRIHNKSEDEARVVISGMELP